MTSSHFALLAAVALSSFSVGLSLVAVAYTASRPTALPALETAAPPAPAPATESAAVEARAPAVKSRNTVGDKVAKRRSAVRRTPSSS